MPTPAEVLKDPNFKALPQGEQLKVLGSLDSNFAQLPQTEQLKVLGVKVTSSPSGFGQSFASQLTPGKVAGGIAGGAFPGLANSIAMSMSDVKANDPKEYEKERKMVSQAHDKFVQKWKGGDPLGAVQALQDVMLNGGDVSAVSQVENQIHSGDLAGAAGTALGILAPAFLAHGVAKSIGGLASLVGDSPILKPILGASKYGKALKAINMAQKGAGTSVGPGTEQKPTEAFIDLEKRALAIHKARVDNSLPVKAGITASPSADAHPPVNAIPATATPSGRVPGPAPAPDPKPIPLKRKDYLPGWQQAGVRDQAPTDLPPVNAPTMWITPSGREPGDIGNQFLKAQEPVEPNRMIGGGAKFEPSPTQTPDLTSIPGELPSGRVPGGIGNQVEPVAPPQVPPRVSLADRTGITASEPNSQPPVVGIPPKGPKVRPTPATPVPAKAAPAAPQAPATPKMAAQPAKVPENFTNEPLGPGEVPSERAVKVNRTVWTRAMARKLADEGLKSKDLDSITSDELDSHAEDAGVSKFSERSDATKTQLRDELDARWAKKAPTKSENVTPKVKSTTPPASKPTPSTKVPSAPKVNGSSDPSWKGPLTTSNRVQGIRPGEDVAYSGSEKSNTYGTLHKVKTNDGTEFLLTGDELKQLKGNQ